MAFDRKAWARENYRKNREAERERSRLYQLDNREVVRSRVRGQAAKKQAYIDEIKSAPCCDCNGKFPPECMDFDHVRGKKNCNVSAMIARAFSLESVIEEIAKCEVVCANCHRIRTRKRKIKWL
jgi:hypothetical protein